MAPSSVAANSHRPISSSGVNRPRAWINDALVTSVRDRLRTGTIVAMEPEASATAVSRGPRAVIVRMPSVAWRSSVDGAMADEVACGWGALPPTDAIRACPAVPSVALKPCFLYLENGNRPACRQLP